MMRSVVILTNADIMFCYIIFQSVSHSQMIMKSLSSRLGRLWVCG